MKNVQIKRLTKFAQHINQIENHPEHGLFREVQVYAYEENIRIAVLVITHHWLFEELIPCFPAEWGYRLIDGDPYWKKLGEDSNVAEAVCDYFGISDYEVFCHLFDLDGYQSLDKWGGNKLNRNSSGTDIAKNIIAYLAC